MRREIMKRAHELARQMEGDYIARLALGLRQAWRKAREEKSSVILRINHQPSGGREWVAEIAGRHPKYKFERKFLAPVERNWSSSGKTGTTCFELKEGKIYEVNEPWKGRRFCTVEAGQIVKVDAEKALAQVA